MHYPHISRFLQAGLLSVITLGASLPALAEVIASCNFTGPYNERGMQDGFTNNDTWGTKDIVFSCDNESGRSGMAQRINIRGISSGELQYFYTKFKLRKNHAYKVSFWMKGEGLDGSVSVFVRKVGEPWTTYVEGWEGTPSGKWEQHSFTGVSPEDVDEGLAGVCFSSGALGTIWISDLIMEDITGEKPSVPLSPSAAKPRPGNLLPRSSWEGRRDCFWAGGVYGGPDAEWEDPQMERAGGGLFGKYCMALPASQKGGVTFCRSMWIAVVPGHPYTFSVYLRSKMGSIPVGLAIKDKNEDADLGDAVRNLTSEWERYSITGLSQSDRIYLELRIPSGAEGRTVLADGFQLETGETATEYKPRYPVEIYADVGQKAGNLFQWGERIPLRISTISDGDHKNSSVELDVQVVGYPDQTVWRHELSVPIGEEKTVNLDLKRNGLFRVMIRSVDEKIAASQEMLLAILPSPRATGVDSSFGTHITVRPFFIDYAWRIGMKWTRFHDACEITKWKTGEPIRGEYQWFDKQVDAVRAGGLHILGLLDDPPKWAQIEEGKGSNVIDLDAFSAYCEKAAEHYRGKIDHWEIWNEPYGKYFFRGTPEQYGEVAATACKAIKKGNPDAKVLGWCTELSGLDYVRKIPRKFRQGIDILSFHFYPCTLTGGGSIPFGSELTQYRDFLASDDLGEYWNTEGANGSLGGNSFYSFLPATRELNDRAVAFASRVWIEHAKAGIGKFFMYTLHQSDTITYYGGYKMLIGYDRSPTPAAVATAVTAWCIDGMKNVPVEPIQGVVQGLFEDNMRATWTVYRDSAVPGQKTLDLRQFPRAVRLLDPMGNDPRKDGVTTWPIGLYPLFAVAEGWSPQKLLQLARKTIMSE